MPSALRVKRIAAWGEDYVRAEEKFPLRTRFLIILSAALWCWVLLFCIIGFFAGLTMMAMRVVFG